MQQKAAGQQVGGLTAGYLGAQDLISGGNDALKTNYAAALQPLQTTFNNATTGTGQQGYQAFADATGANGPEGLARAKALFTQNPGYTEGLNLTLDQNDRRAASRGTLGSGGTLADTTKLATDYASQKYGNYVAGLQPFTAVPGQAQAGANAIAGVNTGLGNALNANTLTQADIFNKGAIGVGNANANATLSQLDADKNMLNVGTNFAKMLMPWGDSLFSGSSSNPTGYDINPWSKSGQYQIPVY